AVDLDAIDAGHKLSNRIGSLADHDGLVSHRVHNGGWRAGKLEEVVFNHQVDQRAKWVEIFRGACLVFAGQVAGGGKDRHTAALHDGGEYLVGCTDYQQARFR